MSTPARYHPQERITVPFIQPDSSSEDYDSIYSRNEHHEAPGSFDRIRGNPFVPRPPDRQPWPDNNPPQLPPCIDPSPQSRSAPGIVPYQYLQDPRASGYVPATGGIPPPRRPYPDWPGHDTWDYKTPNQLERQEELDHRQPNEDLRKIRDDIRHTLATQDGKLRKIQSCVESTHNNAERTRLLIELIAHEDRDVALGIKTEPRWTGTRDRDTPRHERITRHQQGDLERQQERTNRSLASRFERDPVRYDSSVRVENKLGQSGLGSTARGGKKPTTGGRRKPQDRRGRMQARLSLPIIDDASMSGALPTPSIPNLTTETFGSTNAQTKAPSHRTSRYGTRISAPVDRNVATTDVPKRPPFPTAEDAPPTSSSPAPPTPQPATTASKNTKSQTRISSRSTMKAPFEPSRRQHVRQQAKGIRSKAMGAQDTREMPQSRRASSPGHQDGRVILDEHVQEQPESDGRSFLRRVRTHAPQDDESDVEDHTKNTRVGEPRAPKYYEGIAQHPAEDDTLYNKSHTRSADGDSLSHTSQESYSPFEAHSSNSFGINQSVSKSSLSVTSSYLAGPHPILDILSAHNGHGEHGLSEGLVGTHSRRPKDPSPSTKFEATESKKSSLKLRVSSHFKEQMYDAVLDALCDASRVLQAPMTAKKPMISEIPQAFVRDAQSSRRRRFSGHAYTSSDRWSEQSGIRMQSQAQRRSPGHGRTNSVVASESAQEKSCSRKTIHVHVPNNPNHSRRDQELGTQDLSMFASTHEHQRILGDALHSFEEQDSKLPAEGHSTASSQVSAKQEGGAVVGLSTVEQSANHGPQVPSIERSGTADGHGGDVLDSDSDQSFQTASAGCSRRGSFDDSGELGVRSHGTNAESGKLSSNDIATPSLFSDSELGFVDGWRYRGQYQTNGNRLEASLPSVPSIPGSQQHHDYYQSSPQTRPLVPTMLMIPARGHSYYLVPLSDGVPSLAVPSQRQGVRTEPSNWHPQASWSRETEPDSGPPVFVSKTRIRRRRHQIYRKERMEESTEVPEVL